MAKTTKNIEKMKEKNCLIFCSIQFFSFSFFVWLSCVWVAGVERRGEEELAGLWVMQRAL